MLHWIRVLNLYGYICCATGANISVVFTMLMVKAGPLLELLIQWDLS